MIRPIDALVVGAGPAGSATAALLARRGCRVLLIDRAVFPRPKPCGDYLNPGCDAALARLGARDAVARAGVALRGMRLITPEGAAIALPFPHRNGWSLSRRVLDHLLLDEAVRTGAAFRGESRLVTLVGERRGVRIGLEHRGRHEEFLARLVIGADGLHSTVARAAGLGAPVRHGRYTVGAYLAGLRDGAPSSAGRTARDTESWGEIHLRRGGYCGVAYLPGGLANVTLAVPRAVVRAWRGAIEAGYWAWLRGCPGLRDRLSRAERAGPLVAMGPLGSHHRPAGRGRVLLVGDAASHLDPMTGQGVYLALRGAGLCADAAAAALDRTGVPSIRGYAYARWREFTPVFAASRLLQHLAFRPAVVRRAAARLAADPDLASRLIGVTGNTEGAAAVLHPGVLARLMGPV